MSRIPAIFKAITLNWLRSRSGLFFSFLFPVMFLLVFGSIFGNTNTGGYTLYVKDNDACPSSPPCLSLNFISSLNSTKVVVVNSPILAPSVNVTAFILAANGAAPGNQALTAAAREKAYAEVSDMAKKRSVNLRTAAFMVAIQRVYEAVLLRGI